jgi:ribosome biogenesis GTPase
MHHEASGPDDLPVTGDWVAVQRAEGEGRAVVRGVLPRRTAVTRKAAGRRTDAQVLAANVDVIAVVAALDAARNTNRLERYLAVAWDAGAEPVVVYTKSDLAPEAEVDDELTRGVDVVRTSAVTGEGVDSLHRMLAPHRTAVLLGPSGSGKSTLLNALCGTDVHATGAVRELDGRGRHTTTARELAVVPSGGCVIDTPGLRELALWDGAGVDRVFEDLDDLALHCRFRDCAHGDEPDCAVRTAVEDGSLDPARLERHRKLERELAHLDRRKDALATSNAKRRWKAITKASRARGDRA